MAEENIYPVAETREGKVLKGKCKENAKRKNLIRPARRHLGCIQAIWCVKKEILGGGNTLN